MTKKLVYKYFKYAFTGIVSAIILSAIISWLDCTENRIVYNTYKDSFPLLIGLTAAFLAYVVQKRTAFAQQLRAVWSKVIDAVHSSLYLVEMEQPDQKDYREVLIKLNVAIDEIRSLFQNLSERKGDSGLFPFEPIKNIQRIILGIRDGAKPIEKKDREEIVKRIWKLWDEMKIELLKEFDREVPTFYHSHWYDSKQGLVYDTHKIEKHVT